MAGRLQLITHLCFKQKTCQHLSKSYTLPSVLLVEGTALMYSITAVSAFVMLVLKWGVNWTYLPWVVPEVGKSTAVAFNSNPVLPTLYELINVHSVTKCGHKLKFYSESIYRAKTTTLIVVWASGLYTDNQDPFSRFPVKRIPSDNWNNFRGSWIISPRAIRFNTGLLQRDSCHCRNFSSSFSFHQIV